MYKVLIVDDNKLIRKALIKRVDWESLNLKVVGESSNGKDALNLIHDLTPHIVITDIKMPLEDGFYLIQNSKTQYAYMEYIIISGYDDFVYTKKALLNKVVNYILKPINTTELINALCKAKENIENYYEKKIHEENNFIEDTFSCLFQNKLNNDSLIKSLESRNFKFLYNKFVILSFNPTHITDYLNYKFYLKQVKDVILLHGINSMKFVVSFHNHLFFVILNKNFIDEITISKIQDHISNIFSHTNDSSKMYMGQSHIYSNSNCFKSMYEESIKDLYKRFINEKSLVETRVYTNGNLQTAIELGVLNDSCKIAKELLRDPSNFIYLKSTFNTVTAIIVSIISSHDLNVDLRDYNFHWDNYLLQFNNLEEIFLTLEELISKIITLIKDKANNENTNALVLKYINNNFTRSLTLNSMGKDLHLNPIYIGQLIKKSTNMTFNQYMHKLRIDYAKIIMKENKDLKMNQIASFIGYTDPHYFFRIFKKITNMTPREFKEKSS
ncbi:MAG: response regulator [Anaeromicrobium sp.]|jgi:two-component system response regulator YesN|uniref:response regulator transcription factor n=1 Tax=Anaeromicrobium sp. TaxID=1929132 RepID=UPI0025F9F724|nr:response regulator [Anaeromicrobium sp.]MCT4595442.1 response regulator [Anaeromicrobium sp.]